MVLLLSPESNYGFVIACLPSGMQVHVPSERLPSFVNPSLLSLADPRCGVVKMDDREVMLATTLDSCGTTRRYRTHLNLDSRAMT